MSDTDESADDWPESALATLYSACVSFGNHEQQLIWTRYTGFLIVNGFLVTISAALWAHRGEPHITAYILLALGALGLVLNAIWHILNFAGWQNQSEWFNRAANLSRHLSVFNLPTDSFKAKIIRPNGWIYWLAQTIPTILSIIAAAAATCALDTLLPTWCGLFVLTTLVWLIVSIFTLLIEYFAIPGKPA